METIVSVGVGVLTAAIVQLLKKVKLPSKYAPVTVLVVSGVIVAIAKALGFAADIHSIEQALYAALGIGGVTVVAYDQVKKLGEPK